MLYPAWRAACAAFDGHRFVLAWPVAQVARRWVQRLAHMGLEPPFVLGLYEGPSEPLPLPAENVHVLRPGPLPTLQPDDSLFDRWQAAMHDLPASALAALDRWDPSGTALVITPPAAELHALAGRRVFGRTPPLRRELEDKTRVDALLTGLGIPVAPHRVVPVSDAPAVAPSLDRGHGTVWAGDNTSQIEAGARALAHVHDVPTEARAVALFTGRCDTVRIQPFLPGIPCSIQGICTPDGVALTRPTEMLVLHDAQLGEFLLVGMATVWDPPRATFDALAGAARAVGEHLRTVHQWRGGFSLDAVATPDGRVWPTEVNARMSAGLAVADGCLPGPSLELLERLLREGLPIGVPAAQLEAWMTRPLRARRTALVRLKGFDLPATPRSLQLPAAHGGPPVATLHYDGEGVQGVLRLVLDPTRVVPGAPVAPIVEQALKRAARAWGLPVARWRAAPGYAASGSG